MNWLAIVMVSLLAVYIVMWGVDRWVIQPRRRKAEKAEKDKDIRK